MPHIHDLIDFTVAAYIVHENKALLVDHKQLQTWMPVGGHIELDEDPDEALMREIAEECGLEVEIVGSTKPDVSDPGTKALFTPSFVDIHPITDTHRHVGLVYFARAKTDKVVLAKQEHNEIRWFAKAELSDPELNIRPFIRYYCQQAITQAALL